MARRTNLKKLPRKRYLHDKSLLPKPANVTVSSATIQGTATDVKFVFSGAVQSIANGLPTTFTANGIAPVSVVATGVNFITLRYAAAKTAGQAFTIGTFDPTVRTTAGGFVQATAGLLQ